MTHERISHYFSLATPSTASDLDAYVSLFAPDAVVQDDGHTHRGRDEVRTWRSGVPDVTYDVASVEPDGDGWRAAAVVTGDFPGSPITLRFAFEYDADDLVATLTIEP